MAIPGLKPDLQIRGKVKTGETRTSSRTGREYPASTDYFLCPDDPEFARMFGDHPSRLVIEPAFATTEEFFSTGLEWWTKQSNGSNHLACYTKDGGDNPVALRSLGYLDGDEKKLDGDETVGNNRCRIACPFRDCVHLKNKDCKPMGRLTFYAVCPDGGQLGPYQLDTKSWNSVEALEGFLARYSHYSGEQFADTTFDLSVAFETQGDKKFPVLSMKESDLNVDTPADVQVADALLDLITDQTREGLARYLDATRPGWKEDQRYIDRIKEVGVDQAIETIIARERDVEL